MSAMHPHACAGKQALPLAVLEPDPWTVGGAAASLQSRTLARFGVPTPMTTKDDDDDGGAVLFICVAWRTRPDDARPLARSTITCCGHLTISRPLAVFTSQRTVNHTSRSSPTSSPALDTTHTEHCLQLNCTARNTKLLKTTTNDISK